MHLLLNRSFNTLGQGQWSQELTSHHLGTNPSPVSLFGSRQSRSRTPHSPSALHRAATPQLRRGMGLRRGALQPGAGKLQRRGRDTPAHRVQCCREQSPALCTWLVPPQTRRDKPLPTSGGSAQQGDLLQHWGSPGATGWGSAEHVKWTWSPDTGTHHPREVKQCQSKAGRAAVVQQSCLRTQPTAQHLQAQGTGALFGVEKVGMQLET